MIAMSNTIDEFRQTILATLGYAPDEVLDDGAIHRFSTNEQRGDKSGWYVYHPDGIAAGVYGCWRAGDTKSWCAKSDNAMTDAERGAHRLRIKAMRAERDEAEAEKHAVGAADAAKIWDTSTPCTAHCYSERKGVKLHGTRLIEAATARAISPSLSLALAGPLLVIPMRDIEGKLHNLQFIAADGTKRPVTGGNVKGCYYAMGKPAGRLVIAEGYATAASIHEATGDAVAVAFNKDGLMPVALALHAKHPGLQIIVAADDDYLNDGNPGLNKAKAAALAVGGLLAVPQFPTLENGRPDKATDFNDLHQLVGLDAVKACMNAAIPCTVEVPADSAHTSDGDGDGESGNKKDSLASQLVAFVRERVELFHDENRDVFGYLSDAQESFRLTGANFKNWLMAEFFKATGKAARDQSVREALSVLTGLALFDGEQKTVHVRVAKSGDAYFLDLGQLGNSQAVKIEAGRWELLEQHEVRFIRPESMRPLPTPDASGDISKLWKLVNVPKSSRLLVLAWLLECLRADTVFPVLEMLGEAGSAKSSAQKVLRRLIDPNASNLRSPPKSVEDVFVSAGVNWFASFENISHLSAPMQDALCVLATGGGFAKRKLYSDGDESVINVMRPVVLNGISACVTAHDLIDRSICVELPVLAERREDSTIEREFEAAYAGLVGGVLNLMAQTLKELPNVELAAEDRPRMAGFARLGVAMEHALGEAPGEFLRQFHASRQESIERAIDASPVASALVEWFESCNKASAELSVKALLAEVERFKPTMTDAWPKTAKSFGDALRRAAPSLRYMGLEVKSLGKMGSSVKWSVKAVKAGGQAHLPNSEHRTSAVAEHEESIEMGF